MGKIDIIWEMFWTGGVVNPLDVVEQMTYLMFIHDLDESDNTHAKEAAMLGLPYKSLFDGEFSVGEKKKSFYVSQFSYGGYRVGEKGTLKHKGDRLIGFE